MALRREQAGIWMLCALLGACGGDGDDADPLPPAGTSRWAAQEEDENADGTVDAITRYEYDAQGRRIAKRSYRVVNGVAESTPVSEQLWSFDASSRMTESVERNVYGVKTKTTSQYAADGRLATQRSVYLPSGVTTESRYA